MLQIESPEDSGYLAASAIARSNLQLGHSVIADTVNPVAASREMWALTAQKGGGDLVDIEIVCSDTVEHRKRVERRTSDIAGHPVPDWARVEARDYEAWESVDLRVDTATVSPEEAVGLIMTELRDRLNQD